MGAFNTVGPPDNGTLLCKINHKWVIWFAETLKQPIKDYFCGQASQFQVDVINTHLAVAHQKALQILWKLRKISLTDMGWAGDSGADKQSAADIIMDS